jgi:hypothetical protein
MDAESAVTYPLGAVSGFSVLGLLWAVAGILLGTLWWRDRAAVAATATEAGEAATQRVHFGCLRVDRGPRRQQAMRLAYALGAWLVALGTVTDRVLPLAVGAAALNLGTLFRYLLVALDQQALDAPLLELERARHLVLGEPAALASAS